MSEGTAGAGSRTNPATGLSETIGEVQVRGIDLEAKVEMFRGFTVTAAYSRLESEIVENETAGNEGNEVSFVPNDIASLWAAYTVEGASPRGDMTFGVGARYTGSYFFDDANTMASDDAVIFDASYTYQVTENVAVDVIVNDVFDEKHVAYGGFGADFYNPGRSVNATLRYMW